jgi:serpin B
MRRRDFLALLGSPVVLGVLQSCGDGNPGGGSGGSGSLVRASVSRRLDVFAARTYGRLAATEESNLVWSPASVAIALAMTRQGALGATASEMDEALGYTGAGVAPDAVAPSMNALTAELESRSGSFDVAGERVDVTLAIANSLWGQRDLSWEEDFLETLAREFGAGMRIVDYMTDPDAARRAINQWVSDETADRIPELLAEGSVNSDLRLTLVNAVYMKAPWLAPFIEELTADATFTTLDGDAVTVPMMRISETMRHGSGDSWQAVEIPYAGGELAMVVVLPDEGSFAEVESSVADGAMADVVASLTDRTVNLSMPRFDIESRAEMTDVMRALGMNTAFEPGSADFSAMTTDEQLFIGFIVHQANITVDEAGTEAAAATAVGVGATSAPTDPPVDVVVDRPFIFVIRDTITGCPVFMGRIGDPS